MMAPREAAAVLRMAFRPVIDFPGRLEALLASIEQVEDAAETTQRRCGSLTVQSVITCTDDAGDFS